MKKVWILERFASREEVEQKLFEVTNMEVPAEAEETRTRLIDLYTERLETCPDGYWYGIQGKTNYKVFCQCAKDSIIADKEYNHGKSKYRVVKAEVADDAKYWGGYTNAVVNEGVLKYLYATC